MTIYSLLIIFPTTSPQEFVQILISKLWPFLKLMNASYIFSFFYNFLSLWFHQRHNALSQKCLVNPRSQLPTMICNNDSKWLHQLDLIIFMLFVKILSLTLLIGALRQNSQIQKILTNCSLWVANNYRKSFGWITPTF